MTRDGADGASTDATVQIVHLVLAHAQPSHFARLLRVLEAPWAATVVHVDRKVDAAPYAQAIAATRNCEMLPDEGRHVVSWGGRSVTVAALALLRGAVRRWPGARRFVLLSGSDYPVAPAEMRRLALVDDDVEFVHLWRTFGTGDAEPGAMPFDRYLSRCHFRDGVPFGFGPLWRLNGRLPLRVGRALPWVHGSTWWALTSRAASELLAAVDRDPRLLAAMKWSFGSDEILIQSVLASMDGRGRISHDHRHLSYEQRRLNALYGVHYIDWYAPVERLPKTLDLDDFDAIMASGALFARKVDEQVSASLLDRIDRDVLTR